MAVKEKKNGKVSETESKRSEKVSPSIHKTGEKERAAEEAEEVIYALMSERSRSRNRKILRQYYDY
uniref:Uncharacterized protein n=1 Tax=Podoviridae sp. ct2iq11 TaxID=2827720 RepID=A0A8S5TPK5_9CAUD|nr:MAG TPA: hypothetical protein [Podoviridae sp. ct2iq11]